MNKVCNMCYKQNLTFLALLLLILGYLSQDAVGADRNADKETDPLVLKNLEEFQDMKFGLFIHWNPCSQWGARIAWSLTPSQPWARPDSLPAWINRGKDFDRFCQDFFDLNKTFNPKDFNPDQWAQAAAYAGMKYVVFVTKCHDGFCMFDTKLTDYCITHESCPFFTNERANITRAVADAFRKQGLKVGFYFSMPDWHHPDFEDPTKPVLREFRPNYDVKENPEKWQRFLKFMHGQVEELMTHYGPIDILWLDGGAGDDWGEQELLDMARKHQPGILFVKRGAGGRLENYYTPERHIPVTPPDYPWESCITMGLYWAYSPNDYYKPSQELIHLLTGITCKGGNLLLDIGPDAEGRLPEESMKRLEELGNWMKYNSEAIHGTRPVPPYREGQVCLTRKGDTVYLIYLSEVAQMRPPYRVAVSNIQPAEGAEVSLLGRNLPLEWEKHGDGVVVHIPDFIASSIRGDYPYCRDAWTVKISKAVITSDKQAD